MLHRLISIPVLVLLTPPRWLCFHLFLFLSLFVCEQDNSKSYGWIYFDEIFRKCPKWDKEQLSD